MTHQGNGHFSVTLLTKDGSRIGMESLLANQVKIKWHNRDNKYQVAFTTSLQGQF
jgi:hypothetical protein